MRRKWTVNSGQWIAKRLLRAGLLLFTVHCALSTARSATHVTSTYDLGSNPRIMATVNGQPQYGLVFAQRNKRVTYSGVEYGPSVVKGYLNANGELNDGAGNLWLDLIPNLSATPADSYYVVTVNIQGQVHAEIWVVPDVPTVSAEVCRQAQAPSSTAPALFYQFLQQDGESLPQRQKLNLAGAGVSCVDNAGQLRSDCTFSGGGGGSAPLASATTSGTVKTDVTASDPVVYLKTTADTLLAGKASATHPHPQADVTNLVSDLAAKVPMSRTLATTAPLAGGGALSSDLTLSMPAASGSQNGYLTSTNWSTFNAKENALTFDSPLSRSVNTVSCPTCEMTGNKNAASGYAGLNASSKIAGTQLSEVIGAAELTDYSATSGSGSTALRTTITSPATNDCLVWTGSNWVNQGCPGGGDNISVGGTAAGDANFSDTDPAAQGSGVNVKWQINQTPNPDNISAYVQEASGSQGGVVTTGTQTFAGAKTFASTTTFNPGATSTDGVFISIDAPGAAGTRDSHNLLLRGTSYDTAAHTRDWRAFVVMTSQGGAGDLQLQTRLDGGAWSDRARLYATGDLKSNRYHDAQSGFRINGSGGTTGRFLRSDGAAYIASTGSAAGAGSCTNQVVTALNDDAAPTCATVAKTDAAASFVHTDQANTYSGGGLQDMSANKLALPAATTLPGTCTANKEVYVDTDATPAGQQAYLCNSTGDGWNKIGDGGGGAALTVKEQDGTPSVTNIDTIQFDQADGLTVTDLTGGDVQIDCVDASGSAKGCLTSANWTTFDGKASLVTAGSNAISAYNAGDDTAAARSDHTHRQFSTLSWFFPGQVVTGVQTARALVPESVTNCTITNSRITVNTVSAGTSSYNIERCTTSAGNCTATANIYSSNVTLNASTQSVAGGAPNTATITAGDAFRVNLTGVGSSLADVTIAMEYKCENTN